MSDQDMSNSETDFIDVIGGFFSFLKRFWLFISIGLLIGVSISVYHYSTQNSEVKGECIVRLGGAGNSYMTDVLVVLDERALMDGLRNDLSEEDNQRLQSLLQQFKSIEFSVYQRSSIKCLVRYNGANLTEKEAENVLVEAIRNNQTISEYISEESEVMQEELNMLDEYLESMVKVNQFISENTESVLGSQSNSITYPGLVEITTRKSELKQLLTRINWVRVISPLRTESKSITQLKFSALVIILSLIASIGFAGFIAILKAYQARQN